jgi:hypothetical protein
LFYSFLFFDIVAKSVSMAEEEQPKHEHEVITVSKREMRLGLRHRDSFAVRKSHHVHIEEGESSEEAAVRAAVAAYEDQQAAKVGSFFGRASRSSRDDSSVSATTDSQSTEEDTGLGSHGLEELDAALDSVLGGIDNEKINNDDDDNDVVTFDAEDDALLMRVAIASLPETQASSQQQTHHSAVEGSIASQLTHMLAVNETQLPQPERKKSRFRSVAKGMGSFLGLRKSKKKRLAEEAAAAEVAARGGSLAEQAAAAALASEAAQPNIFGGIFRRSISAPMASFSSPSVSISSPSGGTLSRSVSRGVDFNDQMSGSPSSFPVRDSEGLFIPGHYRPRDVPPTSALRTVSAYGPQAGGGGSIHINEQMMMARDGPSMKRRLTFADQHGQSITNTRYCSTLHYSEGAEHEDWDNDGSDQGSSRCSVM